MWPDFFASTFYSMITKYKDECGLRDEDVAEYYFEALFILLMQVVCCIGILTSIDWTNMLETDENYQLYVCQFLTAFVLHNAQVMPIRSGSQMIKFLIYHSEECNHPMSAMSLGALVIIVNVMCEISNICYILSQKRVESVLANFVAFKALTETPDFYAWQRYNFKIRAKVVPNPLIIIEDPKRIYQVPEEDNVKRDSK